MKHHSILKLVARLALISATACSLLACVIDATNTDDPSCGKAVMVDYTGFPWSSADPCPTDGTVILDSLKKANPKNDYIELRSTAGDLSQGKCWYQAQYNGEKCSGGHFSLPPGF